LRSSVRAGRRRIWKSSGEQKQRCSDGGIVCCFYVPIFNRQVRQPKQRSAEGRRGCSFQGPVFSSRGQAPILAVLGCAKIDVRRGWQRMLHPGSDLQFALAGVDFGSHRVCRSRDSHRVAEDVASRVLSSVRVGRRRFLQPLGVQRQRCAPPPRVDIVPFSGTRGRFPRQLASGTAGPLKPNLVPGPSA
jgi:hypothetical protein